MMWTCPKCKHKFYNRNQAHSCGSYTVNDFLRNKSDIAVSLFYVFLDEYNKIGAYELHPVKTRIALLTKMRFASVNKLAKDHIDVHLVLVSPCNDNRCFYRIENLGDRFFIHHIRIYRPEDINDEVRMYMRLAYEIGNRAHILKK